MNFPLIKKTSFAERLFIIAALVVVGFILSAISSRGSFFIVSTSRLRLVVNTQTKKAVSIN